METAPCQRRGNELIETVIEKTGLTETGATETCHRLVGQESLTAEREVEDLLGYFLKHILEHKVWGLDIVRVGGWG